MPISPPKPWERGSQPAVPATSTATTASASPSTSDPAPSVPQRPATLASSSTIFAPNPATTMTTPYSSPYSSYSSPYSRFGTSPYATTSYGGYGVGGYGGGYGGYGGYGGMGGMYGGMGMNPLDPNNPSLVSQVQSSTSQTFALIQSIVQTFTGFAQMLDSTFMATHSSFFAMLGVAEQFSQLRHALGRVLGVFGLVGWLRGWFRGERGTMRSEFRRFLSNPGGPPPPNGSAPKPAKKPIIVFLLAVVGLPYLMHRLIRHLSSRLPPPPTPGAAIDPSKLQFARAVHPFATQDPVELALAPGEIVAILSTADPVTGVEGEWWHGRTREGKEGWFPRAFVDIIKPKEALEQPPQQAEGKKVM